ncbi:copper homeostasis protein cutc [Holotrichia oblita]|nr:copper homeostasis protein cutc [Holotrichia oblita]
MKKDLLVEICCGSLEDAIVAERAGADRIELNSALFLGGLTPTLGTLRAVKKSIKIPVMVMIRPREAGFLYSEYEYEVMKEDACIMLENGADGIAFGFLHADGTIDEKQTEDFMHIIGDRAAVFHRAFDVTPDPFAAMETLISLGVDRILTSGQESSSIEGAGLIKELILKADSRIEILPGGGLKKNNLKGFIEQSGATQVHFSASKIRMETSTLHNPRIFFGGALYPNEDRIKVADYDTIHQCAMIAKEALQ